MTGNARTMPRALLSCTVLTLVAASPALAQEPAPPPSSRTQAADADAAAMDEIVVTGTSIRGAAPIGSNLIAVGREAIDSTSAQTVQAILRTCRR